MFTFSDVEISDLYKDVYGFRPSVEFYESWSQSLTDTEKQNIWDDLISKLQ